MIFKVCFILVITQLSFTAFASVPSVESLFRNNNNADIKTKGVWTEFKVMQVEKSLFFDREKESLNPIANFKYYFNLRDGKSFDVVKLISKKNKPVKVSSQKNLVYYFKRTNLDESKLNKYLFDAVLYSLLVNNSNAIDSLFSRINSKYRSNSTMLNSKKVSALKSEIANLKKPETTKGLTTQKKASANSDDQAREALKESTYLSDENVALTRMGSQFFWKFDLGNINGFFTNETRRLVFLKFEHSSKIMEMKLGQYILFNGVHELPKKIRVSVGPGADYIIEFTSLGHTNYTRKSLNEIEKEYRERVQGNSGVDLSNLPSFLH